MVTKLTVLMIMYKFIVGRSIQAVCGIDTLLLKNPLCRERTYAVIRLQPTRLLASNISGKKRLRVILTQLHKLTYYRQIFVSSLIQLKLRFFWLLHTFFDFSRRSLTFLQWICKILTIQYVTCISVELFYLNNEVITCKLSRLGKLQRIWRVNQIRLSNSAEFACYASNLQCVI